VSRRFLRICCGWAFGIFLLLAFLTPSNPVSFLWGVLALAVVVLWGYLDARVRNDPDDI
jgi:hypothetical protein